MRTEDFLKQVKGLIKLMESFGLTLDDWCISGEKSWQTLGYKIPANRENHIDVLVKSSRLPWKLREWAQTIPQKGSRELELYCKYVKNYGVALHLIGLPKPGVDEEYIKRFSAIIERDDLIYRVTTIPGNLYDLRKIISTTTKEGLGDERYKRWKENLISLREQAEAKKQISTSRMLDKILEDYFLN